MAPIPEPKARPPPQAGRRGAGGRGGAAPEQQDRGRRPDGRGVECRLLQAPAPRSARAPARRRARAWRRAHHGRGAREEEARLDVLGLPHVAAPRRGRAREHGSRAEAAKGCMHLQLPPEPPRERRPPRRARARRAVRGARCAGRSAGGGQRGCRAPRPLSARARAPAAPRVARWPATRPHVRAPRGCTPPQRGRAARGLARAGAGAGDGAGAPRWRRPACARAGAARTARGVRPAPGAARRASRPARAPPSACAPPWARARGARRADGAKAGRGGAAGVTPRRRTDTQSPGSAAGARAPAARSSHSCSRRSVLRCSARKSRNWNRRLRAPSVGRRGREGRGLPSHPRYSPHGAPTKNKEQRTGQPARARRRTPRQRAAGAAKAAGRRGGARLYSPGRPSAGSQRSRERSPSGR